MNAIRTHRTRRAAKAAALLLALGVALAACGSTSSSSSGSKGSTTSGSSGKAPVSMPPYSGPESGLPTQYPSPRKISGAQPLIAYLNPSNNETGQAATAGVQAEAKKLGAKLIVFQDNVSVDRQVSDFNLALERHANAIILYPFVIKALRPSLEQAKAQHVPVVAEDAVFGNLPTDPLIATNVISGVDHRAYDQASQMLKYDPGGKIGLIGLGLPVPALAYQVQRAQYWAQKAGLTVVGTQDSAMDDVQSGQVAMTALLGRYPSMTGVIGYSDPAALGAEAAARTAGKQVKIVGMNGASDGRDAVANHRLVATIQIDIPGISFQTVDAAYELATHQVAQLPKVVWRPAAVVNSETINSVPSWTGEIQNEANAG